MRRTQHKNDFEARLSPLAQCSPRVDRLEPGWGQLVQPPTRFAAGKAPQVGRKRPSTLDATKQTGECQVHPAPRAGASLTLLVPTSCARHCRTMLAVCCQSCRQILQTPPLLHQGMLHIEVDNLFEHCRLFLEHFRKPRLHGVDTKTDTPSQLSQQEQRSLDALARPDERDIIERHGEEQGPQRVSLTDSAGGINHVFRPHEQRCSSTIRPLKSTVWTTRSPSAACCLTDCTATWIRWAATSTPPGTEIPNCCGTRCSFTFGLARFANVRPRSLVHASLTASGLTPPDCFGNKTSLLLNHRSASRRRPFAIHVIRPPRYTCSRLARCPRTSVQEIDR